MKKLFITSKSIQIVSAFILALLLVFVLSSFKPNNSLAPATLISCGMSTSSTSDVDYQLWLNGSKVGGVLTVCAGTTLFSIPGVVSDSCTFNVTGSALTYGTNNTTGSTLYCTTCSANSAACNIPVNPVAGLRALGGKTGSNSRFEFN